MFDFVRKHNRWLQGALLVLILPSFVVFGIQGYSSFSEGGKATVAEVDGHSITQADWDASHQMQAARLRQRMPDVDAKLLDSPEARDQSLEGMIRERVLQAALKDLRLTVGDARLQRLFASDPQFEAVRNPDGSVKQELLAAQGMSSAEFAERLRQDLSLQQVQAGVLMSAAAPAGSAAASLDALLQRRALRYTLLEQKGYEAKAQPTEADLQAYYQAHQAAFRTPEQAQIEYVVLDLEVLKQGLTVAPADLQKYYDENASRYTVAEERRARHILVKAEQGAAADVVAKAKAKAEDLLAQARRNPAGFAELAKQHSDDPGSAVNGGDLDFFARGAMVKPFEDAVFAMQPGEISALVQSEFGFHIIRLDEVRGGQKQSFEAVRSQIEDEVRKQLATARWAEAAEQFTNMVYEQSDSLQPVIDKLKLGKLSATVQRQPAADAGGALASAKLLQAVFAEDALKNKRNTDAIEIGPNQLASARVLQHQPAQVQPLAQVRDAVRAQVLAQQAQALARRDGEALLAKLKAQPQPETLTRAATIARNQTDGVPEAALPALLAADTSRLPAAVGVPLDGQGYLVAVISQVLPRATKPEEDRALQKQYAAAWARAEADAYLLALKDRYKVSKKVAAPSVAASAAP